MGENCSDLELVLCAPGVKGRPAFPINTSSKYDVTALVESIIVSDHRNEDNDDDPFYVLDITTVIQLFARWKRSLPNIRPFYAVKCNPHPALLGALASLGAGFDCASRAEAESVLSLGVPPGDIIYANPCKAASHIKHAAAVGIKLTTVDSEDEIYKIRRCHPKCALVIRLKPSVDAEALWNLGTKYGALPDAIVPLLRAAKSANLAVVGVSFHIGSGATKLEAFRGAIAAARAIFDTADKLGMRKMSILDIGGGFVSGPQFEQASEIINSALLEFFADEPGLTVIAEPGRFFAETPFTLAANIIGRRFLGVVREYWINDGLFGTLNRKVYEESTVVIANPLACSSDQRNPTCMGKEVYNSTVFGPTCHPVDTVLTSYQLPELLTGDWLVFPDIGAYSMSVATNFNGLGPSDICTYVAYVPAHDAENGGFDSRPFKFGSRLRSIQN